MADPVDHPAHYSTGRFTCECIAVTRHMTFLAGNAVKYCWRHAEKNGVEDLRKAAVYLRWASEDGDRAAIQGRSGKLVGLTNQHVVKPLMETPGPHSRAYHAIIRICLHSDFHGALEEVEQAIRDLEAAA
ncbi:MULTISPECIES: DUF3310 domain-containing protein [Nocardia]|uniref:DUF3310 domain-containing protein n=1 Tax=Nocardia TaxID=1817 RepID=UPI000D691458|nr:MULTISPECIES: DUF3310 domain-containing protein [Nocardia]